ncbi:hypothetical protein A2U01_0051862, partial [Trifolium medium]|nr:hypothetical protein [Trifolium medium]
TDHVAPEVTMIDRIPNPGIVFFAINIKDPAIARAISSAEVGADRVTTWSLIESCDFTGTSILRVQLQVSVLIARIQHMVNVWICDHDQHQFEQGGSRCFVAIVRGRRLGRIVGGLALAKTVIRGRRRWISRVLAGARTNASLEMVENWDLIGM